MWWAIFSAKRAWVWGAGCVKLRLISPSSPLADATTLFTLALAFYCAIQIVCSVTNGVIPIWSYSIQYCIHLLPLAQFVIFTLSQEWIIYCDSLFKKFVWLSTHSNKPLFNNTSWANRLCAWVANASTIIRSTTTLITITTRALLLRLLTYQD